MKRSLVFLRMDHLGDLLMTLPSVLSLKRLYRSEDVSIVCSRRWMTLAPWLPGGLTLRPLQPSWTSPPGLQRDSMWELGSSIWALRRSLRNPLVISCRPDPRDHAVARALAMRGETLGPCSRGDFLLHRCVVAHVGSMHEVERCFELVRPLGVQPPELQSCIRVLSPPPSHKPPPSPSARPRVAIHPGAASVQKRWPLHRYLDLLDKLCHRNEMDVIFIVGPGDPDPSVPLRKQTDGGNLSIRRPETIADLAALLHGVSLLICNDSGPMHLAEAVGTPVIALFGPTDERITGPLLAGSRVIQSTCPRRPCWLPGTPAPTCDSELCFDGIGIDTVLLALDNQRREE